MSEGRWCPEREGASMHYLLTKDEYEALHREKKLRTEDQTFKLQRLCTLAAQAA